MILKPRPFRKPRKGHWATKNLVGCWLAGHGGNMALDLSGNGNNGTLAGDTNLVAGKFGQAWDFNGTGDYISTSLTMDNEPLTVAGWLRANVDGSDKGSFVGDNSATPYKKLAIVANMTVSNKIAVFKGDGTDYASISYINDPTDWSEFHHLAFSVANGGAAKIYIDGLEVASGSLPLKSTFTATMAHNYKLLAGQIDNVMIFDRALSAGEIALLYREPFCMFKDEPIELWAAATQSGGTPPITGIMTTNTGYWGSI